MTSRSAGELKRWKPTEAEKIRMSIHRTWFTWPSFVYYAICEQERYDQMLYDMKADSKRHGGK